MGQWGRTNLLQRGIHEPNVMLSRSSQTARSDARNFHLLKAAGLVCGLVLEVRTEGGAWVA